MILKKIDIENFQIFYGKQHLELDKGLYIIHGKNGRGKSTFLNAVTWALFGEYLNRQGEPVTPTVMLNRDAEREGTTIFSVELSLADEEDTIRLKRSFDTADQGAGVRLSVERNGDILNRTDGEEVLRNLFDRDVSRFFLFDGEELRRYEELLFGEPSSAAEVRRSIEHILGLPTLTNAVEDLSSIAEAFDSAATKAARREKGAEQAAKVAAQREADLKCAKEDLSQLYSQKADLEKEVREATAVLQEHQASEELIKQRIELEAEIRQLRENQETMDAMRAESLKGAWRDVLAVAVQPRRDELQKTLATEQQRAAWKREADAIEQALDMGQCNRCGQRFQGEAEHTLRTTLQELRSRPQPTGSLNEVGAAFAALTAIAPTGQIRQAINQDKSISRDEGRIATLSQRLKELAEEAEGIPEDRLREAARRRDKAIGLIEVTNAKIDETSARIERIRHELHQARQEAQKQSQSKEAALLRRRCAVARDLVDIFERAKDQFRDNMRERVGRAASEMFVKLTSDKDLKGLRITENYGLLTLGPDDEPMPDRSAGQEQIVAFALIGALNRNATRRAPVIMDTPLGRLDRTHKRNVLENLGEFGEQVILLIHDDEVSQELIESIRSSIVAEYELHREDLFRTQIQKKALV